MSGSCASATVMRLALVRCPLPKMSAMLIAPIEAPGMLGSSNIGKPEPLCGNSTSISLSLSSPACSLRRKASRVAEDERRADQRVEHPFFGGQLRLGFDVLALAALDQRDGDLDQIADDLLDVAPDIADLGEFRRLDLQERRPGELGEAARDLGLAAAGRADHQDVLRHHLLAHRRSQAQTPPPVAQRDGDGSLGVRLTDDVAVELGDDFAGREIRHEVRGFRGSD